MTQFIIFLIIGLAGIVVGYYFAVLRRVKRAKQNIISEQREEKEENLIKVREFMRGRENVSNDEVEKLLGVSDATATRYLDDLEKEGLIQQIGVTGSSVRYERVK